MKNNEIILFYLPYIHLNLYFVIYLKKCVSSLCKDVRLYFPSLLEAHKGTVTKTYCSHFPQILLFATVGCDFLCTRELNYMIVGKREREECRWVGRSLPIYIENGKMQNQIRPRRSQPIATGTRGDRLGPRVAGRRASSTPPTYDTRFKSTTGQCHLTTCNFTKKKMDKLEFYHHIKILKYYIRFILIFTSINKSIMNLIIISIFSIINWMARRAFLIHSTVLYLKYKNCRYLNIYSIYFLLINSEISTFVRSTIFLITFNFMQSM